MLPVYSYYLYIIVYLFQEAFILFTCFYFTLIKWKKVKVKSLSRVWLFTTPWTVAYHDPPSVGFSRQKYWSGLPFPSPLDLPDPGTEPREAAWTIQPMAFSRPEYGVGSLSLLQRIFPTQGLNQVSSIAGGFTSWATREAHVYKFTGIKIPSKK